MMINFILSKYIISTICAFIIAILIKEIINKKNKQDKKLFASGGFPSAHTTIVTNLFFLIGFTTHWEPIQTSIIALIFAITVYDAVTVRYEAGLHAKYLNEQFKTDFKYPLGHTYIETLGGFMLGLTTATITTLIT